MRSTTIALTLLAISALSIGLQGCRSSRISESASRVDSETVAISEKSESHTEHSVEEAGSVAEIEELELSEPDSAGWQYVRLVRRAYVGRSERSVASSATKATCRDTVRSAIGKEERSSEFASTGSVAPFGNWLASATAAILALVSLILIFKTRKK